MNVLIVDGESNFALPVIWCLAEVPGLRVHVLSQDRWTAAAASRYVRSFRTWSASGQWDLVDQIRQSAAALDVDVCVAVGAPAIQQIGRDPRMRGLPVTAVPSSSSFDTADDKWRFACFAAERQLPHPETALCSAAQAFEDRMHDMRFPVLIKPRLGGNGAGIRRFDHRLELSTYLAAHPQALGRTIVQTEVSGYDVDCSVLCEHGEVLAHTIQTDFANDSAQFRPSGGVEFIAHDGVLRVVRRLMAALEWNGVAHIDLRCDSRTGEVEIIEINPRFWGSLLGSLHAGVNFPHLACLTSLGLAWPPMAARETRYVAGGTALRRWSHGRIGRRRAGFAFGDTVFAHMVKDPMAHVLEVLAKTGGTASQSGRRLFHSLPGLRQPQPSGVR
jgi:predicted ATP-grasp superfamily ATP-dependent carboligase